MASMEPVISSFMRLFLLSAFLVVCLVIKVSGNIEGDALNALKNSMSDPTNVLQSWDATIVTPCTWSRVTCNSENGVIRVDLGNANLSGELVPQLGQLQNLQYLELYSNNITGKIPDEIGNLTNLVGLDLYLNKITGSIPDNLANLKKLRFLRLNNNNLSGKIPMRLTTVTTLQVLDLSYNNLEGDVPVNGSFSFFTLTSFKGNPLLNPAPPTLSTPTRQQNPSGNGNRAIEAIAGEMFVVGAALLFAAPLIAIIYEKRRKLQDFFFDVAAEEDPEVHLGQLRRFSLQELQFATDNFNNKNFLGEGASGKVYKGRLISGELVAVKRLVPVKRINEELTQGWQMHFLTEVEMISVAVHQNLLRLRGFCITPTERILVYPYMVNGSVASNLRDRSESQPPLDWHKRKRIALVAARVLAYLHDHCDPKVIHRDVKATNILLDEEFEAVVGDFGLAKLMSYEDTDVTSLVRGTIGHIPPEYLSTGKTSEKTDTYGYGVMLFELITGQGASGLARLADDDDLVFLDWVKLLMKEKRIKELVDADLNENYDEREVEDVIQLALLCTQGSPWERPKMSEVVRMLEGDGLAEKWDQWWHREHMIQQNFTPTCLKATSWPFPLDSPLTSDIQQDLSGPR